MKYHEQEGSEHTHSTSQIRHRGSGGVNARLKGNRGHRNAAPCPRPFGSRRQTRPTTFSVSFALASLALALAGYRHEHHTLIRQDSAVVVNGALGRAQRWRRHGWYSMKGNMAHLDLREQILPHTWRANGWLMECNGCAPLRAGGGRKVDSGSGSDTECLPTTLDGTVSIVHCRKRG